VQVEQIWTAQLDIDNQMLVDIEQQTVRIINSGVLRGCFHDLRLVVIAQ